MEDIYRDPAEISAFIEAWIRDRLNEACASGAVLGLSGGVDSAALAALLRRVCGHDNVLAVAMPCHSMPVDELFARMIAEKLDIPLVKMDLTATYDEYIRSAEASYGEFSAMAKANIKPRMRMTTLYAIAQSKNYLVFGASNRDELGFGYFTKYGDSGVDALPMADLLKGEVFALARYLGVPDEVVNRPPTAGLWEGQTDEGEMGVTYDELDRYFATGEGAPETVSKIEHARALSAHKRAMPPMAIIPKK